MSMESCNLPLICGIQKFGKISILHFTIWFDYKHYILGIWIGNFLFTLWSGVTENHCDIHRNFSVVFLSVVSPWYAIILFFVINIEKYCRVIKGIAVDTLCSAYYGLMHRKFPCHCPSPHHNIHRFW